MASAAPATAVPPEPTTPPPSHQPAPSPPPARTAPAPGAALGGVPPFALAAAAAAVLGIAALVYFVVLGGDGAEGAGLNPARADELAAAAMFGVGDLPGSGWRLTEVDEDDDSLFADEFPDSPACAKVAPAFQAVERSRPQRVGSAQRAFQRAAGRTEPTNVEAEVSVYADAKSISSIFENFKKAVESADFQKCLQELFEEGLGSGETLTVKKVSPYASAPSGGTALAYELEFRSRSEQLKLRLEVYYWRFGNTVAVVTLSGDPAQYGADVARAAVGKLDSGLDAAASANPPTAIPAVVGTNTPARSPLAQATTRPGTAVATGTARPSGTATSRFGRLADLNSFKSSLKISGFGGPLAELQAFFGGGLTGTPSPNQQVSFEVEGVYVKPERGQQTIKLGALTVVQTTIGRQQWTSFSGILSGPSGSSGSLEDYSLVASLWDENFLDVAPPFTCVGGRENVNGVATRKCGIDAQTFNALSGFIGPFLDSSEISRLDRFSFEIWVAEAGEYPVRIRLEMAGKDASNRDFSMRMDVDITDVNSSSNRVEQPR
ncbi:MAG TPA: hypothetical protein VNN10_10565 [Dehalococcoidia bacterium]|nr:hypothetical protein [Dehalococcoidia bacterium]